MSADQLLACLDKVKSTGSGRWVACCPSHKDKHPSLAIRELDDGRILLHCFAGCSPSEVLSAAGLSMDALFPERSRHALGSTAGERRPFPAADVLRAIAFEALVVATAGAALLSGQPFAATDRERLMLAVSRIQAAVTASGVRHDA